MQNSANVASSPMNEPRQLPLDLTPNVALGRDDLVVAPSNATAVAIVERWPDWPSPVVILAGPAGAGKTHLASIWRERAQAYQIDARQLGQASAREAASHRPVLIDSIDSAPIDEVGLFHLINSVRQAGTSLLLVSQKFPAGWDVRLPDLQSRLKAASTVEIHEPDDDLLAAVILKLFSDRQIEVEPHVVQFIVRRIERSLFAANAVVAYIDRVALERKMRVTRSLAAEVMAEIESGQERLEL